MTRLIRLSDEERRPTRCSRSSRATEDSAKKRVMHSPLEIAITKPHASNKIVPGNAAFLPGRLQEPNDPRAKALHRAARYKNLPPGYMDVPSKNGSRKDTLCINEWTAAERSGKQCDEYPPATTHEGAAFAGTNVSIKPLDRLHNRDAGNDLNLFYERFRILDGDKFWVRIK